jgi:aspartate racemase
MRLVDTLVQAARRWVFILKSMKKGHCLGLVGGLGVGAAVHYYRSLAKAHAAHGLAMDMAIVHAEAEQTVSWVRSGDRMGLAEYLGGFIDRLKAAGAEFAVIPAVTPHFCLRELEGLSSLPLINIFDPLIEEIERRKVKRVAVYGTRYTIESQLFGFVGNVEFCQPRPDEVEYIHQTYTALVERGVGTEEQFAGLTKLAQTLQRRDGVDTILMAGTDLSLLFDETNTEFSAIDCAALHIGKILDAMIG